MKLYQNLFVFILCTVLLGCSSNNEYKLLVADDNMTCISEAKERCIEIINNKCNSSFKTLREENFEYIFEPNKYIISFICANK